MKSDQAIEYNKTFFSSNNHAKNEIERLVPDIYLFSKKAYVR